jgi:hypothetical protein
MLPVHSDQEEGNKKILIVKMLSQKKGGHFCFMQQGFAYFCILKNTLHYKLLLWHQRSAWAAMAN